VVIVARDLEIPEEMRRAAEEKQIAILTSRTSTSRLSGEISSFLVSGCWPHFFRIPQITRYNDNWRFWLKHFQKDLMTVVGCHLVKAFDNQSGLPKRNVQGL